MTLKQKLITGYVALMFIVALYSSNFGPFQNQSFAYNLGRGVVWPFTIFPTMGTILSLLAIGGFIAFVVMTKTAPEGDDA